VAEVDIGDVINGTETLSFHILPADLIWVKFNLSEDVPGNANDKYLDVDTEGTPPAGGGAQGDTFLAYYIDGGFRLASDDDDGNQLLSQLTHGATSPVREPAGVPASGAAPARLPYDGRDGSLTAGAYLVALTMFDNDSGVTPINAFNYDATSSHSIDNSGLKLNFRSNTGVTPPAGCSPADVATEGSPQPFVDGPDGFITGTDFDVFVQAFFQEIRRPAPSGPFIADLTDDTGTGGPDTFITGSDFDFFITKFFIGCP